MTETTPSRRARTGVPLFLALLAWVVFYWRYGYAYAVGDHDEVLPLLYHLIDSDLLAADWFVQTQTAQLSVRTYFVWVLRALCVVFPPWLAVALLYGLLWVAVAWGLFRLCERLFADRTAAALAVVAVLGVTHKWTLGGNDLVYTMLAPEMAAWALALPALRLFVDERLVPAAILLGVATWFQLLVGLLTALTLGGLLLVGLARAPTAERWREAVRFGTCFLLFALPAVVPITAQQLRARTLPAEPSVFYILGPFRNPFHHMAFSFEPREWLKVALAVTAGGWGWWSTRKQLAPDVRRFLAGFFGIVGLLCAATLVFTEFVPVLMVAKFQAYKLTVLAKALLVGLACAGVVRWLPAEWISSARGWLNREALGWSLTSALVALTLGLALAGWEPAEARLQPLRYAASPLAEVERWAAANTPLDAVFAVPPSNSTFRSNARRAVVVNYAAFPFNDVDMQVWYRRLTDLAPIDPPRRGLGLRPKLDAAYHGHDGAAWSARAGRYGIDFVLVDTRLQRERLPFPVAFEAAPWRVYRIERGPS